ncbi:hypothetical protein QW180_09885 [Vibrio sinaloensis]|nr:hypothetical protein [Vibrio sinaloensis]
MRALFLAGRCPDMLSMFKRRAQRSHSNSLLEPQIILSTESQLSQLTVEGSHQLVIAYLSPNCANPESVVKQIGQILSDVPNRLVLMSSGIIGGDDFFTMRH